MSSGHLKCPLTYPPVVVVEPFVLLSLLAAVGFSVGHVCNKGLLRSAVDHATTLVLLSTVFAPVFVLPVAAVVGDLRVIAPGRYPVVLAAAVAFVAGGLLNDYGTKIGEVSRVSLTAKTIPLFALPFSTAIVGTTLTPRQYAGWGLVLAATLGLPFSNPADDRPTLGLDRQLVVLLASAAAFALCFVLTKLLL